MNLSAKLDDLRSSELGYFGTIERFLDDVQVDVTFWGGRVIKMEGCNGSLSLVNSIKKIFQRMLGHLTQFGARIEMPDADIGSRIPVVLIMERWKQWSKHTDEAAKNRNFFTRFLYWLRNNNELDLPLVCKGWEVRDAILKQYQPQIVIDRLKVQEEAKSSRQAEAARMRAALVREGSPPAARFARVDNFPAAC